MTIPSKTKEARDENKIETQGENIKEAVGAYSDRLTLLAFSVKDVYGCVDRLMNDDNYAADQQPNMIEDKRLLAEESDLVYRLIIDLANSLKQSVQED